MGDTTKPTLTFLGNFLSKLSENSDHVYWLSSPDFKKIQFISPAYEFIWGRPREELYLNPDIWITFIHPDDRKKQHPLELMAEKIACLGDAARFSEQYRIIRPDGAIRWIMDKGFPIYDNHGLCCGVTGVAVDITEEKQRQLQLKKAKEAAEAANRAKIQFIENMSHDIRTPLGGVIGMSGLLLQGLRDVQQKQYAQWINDSGEQLLKLLNGILEVISADAVNEQDINKEFFDLRQCVQDIIELEMPTAYLKGLELKADVGNNIPKFVYSDRIKIHRVMLNLLGNAIKFTDKGTVLISVQLLERNNQQAKIRFSVSDTGIGIFQEQQARVFERFHKVTPSSKGLYTGYGVGLHIVMAYVQLLGGEIKLNSNPGEGTTFGFDLDLECLSHHILNATTNTTMEPVDKENNAQIIVNKSYHVLLVEDNIIALKVAEALARHLGCLITCASDGEEAFTLIQTMAFDLIITDIGLPGMSGYELTQSIRTWELKNNKKVTTIIGLTAHSYEFAKDHCFASGMNEVYSKPMTAELMNSIIATHLLTQHTAQHATQGVVGRLGDELPDREEELFNLTIFPFLDSDKAIKTIGNEGLVKQVLQLMISDAIPKDIAAIEAAHLDAHWDEVKQLAHKMKGGAVYVGTVKMQYACMYLERYQKAGHASLLEPLYQQLITVVQATQDHIRAWLKNN